jgi:GT2 family glycosyltransferase
VTPVPVDIVIVARNEAAMIGACLEALAQQDYPQAQVRVAVVDDHSTDRTAAIVTAAGGAVLSSTSSGAAAGRNTGIRAGSAPLVGFLDAHSIPAVNWISTLVRMFDDQRIGGSQARLISRATDPRVDRYVRESAAFSDAGIIDQTVAGARTLYPWLLSGNCMYRRSALEQVGLFDEGLMACEDVDLGWRVVLAGYLLTATTETAATHMEGRAWRAFLRKGFGYGRGAACVARAYTLHGASTTLSPPLWTGGTIGDTCSGFYYWAGYRFEQLRRRVEIAARPVPGATHGRAPMRWTPTTTIAVAPTAVYWFQDAASVIVAVPTRQRIVLDGAGDFIWRLLTGGADREAVIAALVERYGIGRQTAEPDVDDLIDELAGFGILTRT